MGLALDEVIDQLMPRLGNLKGCGSMCRTGKGEAVSALQADEDGRRIRAQWGIAAYDLDQFGAVAAVAFGVTEVLRRLSDLEPTWPDRPVTISIKPNEDGVIVQGQVIVP